MFFLIMGPRGIAYRFLCLNITVACTPWLSLVPLSGSWCKWMWRGPRTRLRSQRVLLPPLVSWLSDPGRSWHWCGGPRSNPGTYSKGTITNVKKKKDLYELKLYCCTAETMYFLRKKKIKNTAYKSDISWYYTISDYLQILHQYWLVEEVKYLL